MISESTIDLACKDLFEHITFQAEPSGLYDPLRYMVSIGGKRLRPRLCLMTFGLYRDALTPEVLSAAAGMEVFHTFTLIHDDIMDRSPLRRGHETVWKKWNQDTAILSGDVMYIDACRRIAKVPAGVLPAALDLFYTTAQQVMDGQQMDMDFESMEVVPMLQYMQMTGLKTAVLLACSAKMGALIAGAPEADAKALYDYAYDLGLAFQVADDYLDAYGDSAVFGKPIGGDIVNCKKSWLTVKAHECGAEGLEAAMALPAETPLEQQQKIAAVKALYEKAGVPALAREEIARLHQSAVDRLRDLAPESREVLAGFARKLVGRTM
ncbi:MAG: polyprenyl synthetase family protein [Bacteroidales bacterium]|nr:polyprenyl synthetase family protein [Bacteroidales bacterium]